MSNLSKTIAILGVVAGLGVAALPLSTYADVTPIPGEGDTLTATKDVQVQLNIEETLSMYVTNEAGDTDVASPVSLTANSDTTANYQAEPIAVKVIANNAKGFALTMHGSATKGNATSLTNDNNAEIVSGVLSSTSISEWGYKSTKENGTEDAEWQMIGGSDMPAALENVGKPTGADGRTTLVRFGAHVVDTQESGIYNGQVTFTATANASA